TLSAKRDLARDLKPPHPRVWGLLVVACRHLTAAARVAVDEASVRHESCCPVKDLERPRAELIAERPVRAAESRA
ncbi:MAG: hypothetical protein ABIP03_14595, partial [Aquihabitans sp.]